MCYRVQLVLIFIHKIPNANSFFIKMHSIKYFNDYWHFNGPTINSN